MVVLNLAGLFKLQIKLCHEKNSFYLFRNCFFILFRQKDEHRFY
jgi:hypothetical protein